MKVSLSSLSELLDILPDATIVADTSGQIVFANSVVSRVLGYDAESLVGRPLNMLIPDRFHSMHDNNIAGFRETGHSRSMGDRSVLYAMHQSGEEVPVSISIANVDVDDTRLSVALVRDVTSSHEKLNRAMALSQTDHLTGCGNRLALSMRIQTALQERRRFGLLFIDLTHFKPFNDMHGHQVGDDVLRLVAKRMQAHVRSGDILARIGGDEFVIMLDGLSDVNGLRLRARTISDSICEPFEIQNVCSSIEVSVGGSLYPRDGQTESELIEVADQSMYRAKQQGQRIWIADQRNDVKPAGDAATR